jgi:uncharacterized membrane protein (TIGR02234 family)
VTPGRRRFAGLALLGVVVGVALLAWSQPWFVLTLDVEHVARGDVASPALPPLALATLAAGAALALAGAVFRRILAVLIALLGVCVLAVSILSLSDPVAASMTVVSDATGIVGEGAADLVQAVAVTGWPWVAVGAGIAQILVALGILVSAGSWPAQSRRYSSSRVAAGEPWDALSDGADPTADDPR